jgi:hypothetical protein
MCNNDSRTLHFIDNLIKRVRISIKKVIYCTLLPVFVNSIVLQFVPIDLVLIDQQSVGKRGLHLMDSINAKKRWTTIY